MQTGRLGRWLACTALAATAAVSTLSHGQDWPSGPVRVIVPFAAGSTPDITARLIGERLTARLGQPMVVENKTGAAGNIGTDAIAKAKPDGQAIGLSIAGPLAVNSLLYGKMPYDPARDLQPVTIATSQPAVLVVANRVPARNAAELLALLKKQPKALSYSSMGAGTISHLAVAALAARSEADPVHVPYPGSGAAVTAVIAGDVDMAILPAATVMPHVRNGRIKALAVASAKRSPSLPDLPTLAEAGIADVQADAWIGYVVPAGTPAPIVKRLHDEIVAVLAEPAMREKLRLQFMDPVGNTPDAFRRVMAEDVARWKPVIEKHRIRLD